VKVRIDESKAIQGRLGRIKFLVEDPFRIDDVGDYYDDKIIVYGGLKKPEYITAVAIHEFIEYLLIKSFGISTKEIDYWDFHKDWRKFFTKGYWLYNLSHKIATWFEKRYIKTEKLDWKEYDDYINKVEVRVRKETK